MPASPSTPPLSLLTHVQRSGYWDPFRSVRDRLLGDESNVSSAADYLLNYALELARTSHPASSHMVILFGDDHRWEDAIELYPGVDRCLAAINSRTGQTGVQFQYSTPSRFLRALHAEQLRFPVRPSSWDMLPLIGDEMQAPWSGFYMSRPDFKSLTRSASALYHAASTLHALTQPHTTGVADQQSRRPPGLEALGHANGLAVAHDALPGDSFGAVDLDFRMRLQRGMVAAADVASSALGCTSPPSLCANFTHEPCPPLLTALNAGTAGELTIFNPQPWTRVELLELLVPATAAAAGLVVTIGAHELVCQLTLPDALSGERSSRAGIPTARLSFQASLRPLGLHRVRIAPTPSSGSGCVRSTVKPLPPSGAVLDNGFLSLAFDSSGTLHRLGRSGAHARDGAALTVAATAHVLAYSSRDKSENAWDFSTDGAPFSAARPFGRTADAPSASSAPSAPTTTAPLATVLTGPVLSEVSVSLDPAQGVTMVTRLVGGGSSRVEAEHFARLDVASGPFSLAAGKSVDAVLRLETNISSGGRWLTDSNGLDFLERMVDSRPWFPERWIDTTEPVASNFYPFTLAAILPTAAGGSVRPHASGSRQDQENGPGLAVLTAASQGAASGANGSIEVMLNRAVLDGNAASPTSCANSTGNHLVTLSHRLVLARSSEVRRAARRAASTFSAPPVVFTGGMEDGCVPDLALDQALPPQIKLVTLEALPTTGAEGEAQGAHKGSTSALLRLMNLDDSGDAVRVELGRLLLPRYIITAATELTVDGMIPLSEAKTQRLSWLSKEANTHPSAEGTHTTQRFARVTSSWLPRAAELTVDIAPLQLRTMRVSLRAP